jgi:hypothetical protein
MTELALYAIGVGIGACVALIIVVIVNHRRRMAAIRARLNKPLDEIGLRP